MVYGKSIRIFIVLMIKRCTILIIDFYSTVFCLLNMFRTNLVVHYQEHGIMYCVIQFGTIGTVVLAARLACTTVPIVPNLVIQYIMP